jgi:hypothetical protein
LAPDTLGRLRSLDEFDLTFLTEKLITKSEGLIGPDLGDLALRELKLYLAFAAIYPGANLIPSAQIDAAWHELILFTPIYR